MYVLKEAFICCNCKAKTSETQLRVTTYKWLNPLANRIPYDIVSLLLGQGWETSGPRNHLVCSAKALGMS